jgi:nucleoside phosphorylase
MRISLQFCDLLGDAVCANFNKPKGRMVATPATETSFRKLFREISSSSIRGLGYRIQDSLSTKKTGMLSFVMTQVAMHSRNLLFLFLVSFPLCVEADSVAFFYALEADFVALRGSGVSIAKPTKVGGRSIQVLTLGRHKVYAVKMGSGAVETAISGEALLSRFQCDRAYSLGPVGALSADLQIGKWYDVGLVVGYQKGSWTRTGFQLKQEANATAAFRAGPTQTAVPALFQHLRSITIASGEVFIASTTYREQLHSQTNAEAVDMNLFGLIAACANHHVDLVNWRVVSDKADDNAAEDFRKFTQTYDGAGGKALAELIKNLPPNPNSPETYPELEKLLRPNKSADGN